jgi:hypothetical protein
MRKVVLLAARSSLRLGDHGVDGVDGDDGDRGHRDVDQDRRHLPAVGPASLYLDDSRGDEGLILVRQCSPRPGRQARRLRSPDRLNYKDDQYSPPQAVQLTRELVEQDGVFAVVGSLGTEVNLAIRPVPESKKVRRCSSRRARRRGAPTGSSTRDDRLAARLPTRGQVLRQAIAHNSPNAKIGVLYQNDDYGEDY